MSFLTGSAKKRPVQLYECAACGKNIAEEAVPIAVRVAAFVVPQATRDRGFEQQPFDITDVGIPAMLRELVDQDKHPEGHVYLGLGCYAALFGQQLVTADGTAVDSVVPMRAILDEEGIANTSFTGREHRTEPSLASP